MKLIYQSHHIINYPEDAVYDIASAARACYKSEAKATPESDEKLVKSLIGKGHHAMLEFGDIWVKFITNRGVSHELVRHRMASYAQESTRYVKYDGDIEFIYPVWWDDSERKQRQLFRAACGDAAHYYHALLEHGWKPQQAREVLPNALKTEIIVKANLREWRHILNLRTAKSAHPQIRALVSDLLKELQGLIPIIFDDI